MLALIEAQRKMTEQIALSDDLHQNLKSLCLEIERLLAGSSARSSILLLQDGHLLLGAAPHLPDAYNQAIHGAPIGPRVGSCGTAAWRREQVIVVDIANDPLWMDYRDLALPHGMRACWSTPILASDGSVLGSFAVYYDEVKEPQTAHLELIAHFTYLAGLAIEKARSRQRESELLQQLRQSHEKLQSFISVMPDLGFILSEDGRYVDIYGSNADLKQRGTTKLVGRRIDDVLPNAVATLVRELIQRTLTTDQIQRMEYELTLSRGTRTFEGRTAVIRHYLPEDPEARHVLWMERDITERKQAERRIEQLAYYDVLTHLPNRMMLSERLQEVIARTSRREHYGALLFIDLDDFKRINDSLGHSVGDQLLIMIARRLQSALRDSDIVARLGGDEFVVLIERLHPERTRVADESSQVADRILEALARPFEMGDSEFRMRASIGIALIEPHQTSEDEILRNADAAMYQAKHRGGSQFSFYEPHLQAAVARRLQIERDLVAGLRQGEFRAFYQPVLDRNGHAIGAETLVRWFQPRQGMIAPSELIPVAEQSGLISTLQGIVLEEACRLLIRMDREQLLSEGFALAINISAIQFRSGRLCDALMAVIGQYDLSPTRFKLEITETLLLDDLDDTIRQMNELKALGFRFSIDDFGKGYSSLSYLQSLPVDELKIDRSFVLEMHSTPHAAAIVDSIIDLARHMGFGVIAEGVETAAQFRLIQERPVNGLQGFFLGKPMSEDDFIDWLRITRN